MQERRVMCNVVCILSHILHILWTWMYKMANGVQCGSVEEWIPAGGEQLAFCPLRSYNRTKDCYSFSDWFWFLQPGAAQTPDA